MKQTTITGKVLVEGWIGKSANVINDGDINPLAIPEIYKTKGSAYEWNRKEWPPRKVIIMEVPEKD